MFFVKVERVWLIIVVRQVNRFRHRSLASLDKGPGNKLGKGLGEASP